MKMVLILHGKKKLPIFFPTKIIFYLPLRIQTDPGVLSTSYKMRTGGFFPGVKAAELGLANLLLPSAVDVYMWTLAPTSSAGLHNVQCGYPYLYTVADSSCESAAV